MTRQRIQVAGGLLMLALVTTPASAQFSRSADRSGGDTGRSAVSRDSASAPAARPTPERRGGDSPGAARERPSEARQESAPPRGRERGDANAERPAPRESGRPGSGEPARSSREPRRSEAGPRGRHEGNDGRGWHDNDGGLVMNPILIRGVTVAGQSISPPTLIGKRVVIGQTKIESGLHADSHARKQRNAYPYGVVYLDPGIAYESAPVDDAAFVDYEDDSAYLANVSEEPRVAMPAAPSLASLGSFFSFTPWYALTERITAGYPVAYPDRFAVTYEQVGLRPGASPGEPADLPRAAVMAIEAGLQLIPYAPGTFGGLSFQIEPQDAEVYVDDVFVGLLEDFPANAAPLPLPAGTHRIELRATGFRVETFDVMVLRGQVTPLSGVLLRFAR